MNQDKREVLLIGGKHDGRHVKTDLNMKTIELVDPLNTPTSYAPYNSAMTETISISKSVYLIDEYRAGGRSFWVGRPPDQSVESTFALLMQAYRGL